MSLDQGPAPVKCTNLLNINPRGSVNKIKKQYLIFISNYKLDTQFWSPQYKKRELWRKAISVIINGVAEAVVFEVKLF